MLSLYLNLFARNYGNLGCTSIQMIPVLCTRLTYWTKAFLGIILCILDIDIPQLVAQFGNGYAMSHRDGNDCVVVSAPVNGHKFLLRPLVVML